MCLGCDFADWGDLGDGGGKDGINKDGLRVIFVFTRWNLVLCDLISKEVGRRREM